MNTAKESNLKSIIVISLVSILLFGIFYYLITDVSNTPSKIEANSDRVQETAPQEQYTAYQEQPVQEAAPAVVAETSEVKGTSTESVETPPAENNSVFKALSTQKSGVQTGAVLGGTDQQPVESTVPATGSETIFAAFVISSLVMFTGIYLLLTQPKNAALAKFEKRIIRELD